MTTIPSINFNATLSKKEARKWRTILNPLTRPAHISPKKKVSWRLVKNGLTDMRNRNGLNAHS